MSDDVKRKHGAVTDYRPDDDSVRGDKYGTVQREALGAEGDDELANSGATSGGAAGRVESVDRKPHPKHDGGENPDNRGLTR